MSELEDRLVLQLRDEGLPEPVREYGFAPPRRWRFDLAWPEIRLAAEVEGATWAMGRHVRGAGFAADCEKYNTAALAGWRVLRFTAAMIDGGRAIEVLRDALKKGGAGLEVTQTSIIVK